MRDQWKTYRLYANTIKRLLLFTGLWPSRRPSTFYRLVTVVHGFASFLTCCALLNFAYQHIETLPLFFKGFGSALSFLTILQKMICLTFYRRRLVKLHDDLATTFDLDLNDIELRPVLLSPLLSFYEPSLTLSTVTYMTIAVHWVTPILFLGIQIAHGVQVLKFILPYPTAYPWQANANMWLYLSHYAFEIYAGICVVTFTSLIDALFGFYIFQICGQLRTLSCRLRNFKSTANYRQVLRECIDRHQILTRCQNHLERIYGPIVLWMLVTNAMLMCALIYQATHVSPTKAAVAVTYIVMKSVQTLTYGWFGSLLEHENGMFREAIYASDWPGSGEKRLMTDVLIMMTYKPFVLKACSLSNISIDMFVTVCNTAISYYLLLKTLEEPSHNR
ncbi:odorant receptor 13a-like [Venturia canescens]|uniref:odorant receptor 13a-like n=1 Tax=Venturia canescens TaxID=32260 RepID=UPI001C9D4A00|nr:odorant receptor 13a-like [Venturia canescens]